MANLNPPPSVASQYSVLDELIAAARAKRAAFSWDDVTFEEDVPCGYISERGASKLRIPDSFVGLPVGYVEGAEYCGMKDGESQYTVKNWYKGQPYFKLRMGDSSSQAKMTDRDFLIAYAVTGKLTHCASDQAEAVVLQPDWVTFVMNADKLANMAREGYRNWTSTAVNSHEAAREHSARVVMAEKGLRGALDWIQTHGDLIFQAPTLRSEERVARWMVRELEKALRDDNYRDRPTSGDIQAFITSHKGMDGRLEGGHPVVRFWGMVRKWIERFEGVGPTKRKRDLGRIDKWEDFVEQIEKLDHHMISRHWIMTFYTRMVNAGIVKIRADRAYLPAAINLQLKNFEACLTPERIAWAMQAIAEKTEWSWDNILEHARLSAKDIIRRELDSPYSDLWYRLGDAAMQLSDTGPVVLSAGYAQKNEARRMARAGWPHILNKHPDSRKPQVHESFGDITVYDLDTVQAQRFDLTFKQVAMLCDERGDFLPYAEMVAVLKRVFDDFDGDPEIESFIAGLLEEHDNAEWIQHIEHFLRVTYSTDEIRRMWGLKLETDHWWPLLRESEEIEADKPYSNTDSANNEHAIKLTYSLGCETYEAVYLDPETGLTPAEQCRHAAAGFVYNGYGDCSKMCWLKYRGMIGDGDEVYSKEWNPFKDLKPNMAKDFVDFCFEVPDVDGWQHEISRYDGKGTIYTPEPLSNGETAESGKHEMVPQGWGVAYYREG